MLLGTVSQDKVAVDQPLVVEVAKNTHIDFNVEEDEEDQEEIRKQFLAKFNQQNGLSNTYNEEYEYEEEQ